MPNAFAALVLALVSVLQAEPGEGRLYGRVLTADGERFEGWLRWDRNETHVFDVLDGQKPIPHENDREAEELDADLRARRQRERSFDLPGLRITWDEDDGEQRTTAAGIRFGHIRSLEVVDARHVRVVLRSGSEVELGGLSSDIGRSFRGLVVEDASAGTVEIRWRDLDRVDLLPAPPSAPPPSSERLYGTLRTQEGVELTGYVAWDLDEALSLDVLDGTQAGRDMEIPFGRIAVIRRESDRAAHVTLRSGEDLVLRGTNDVNSDNRGIEISDPGLGRVIVPWDAFESVRFHPRDRAPVASRAAWSDGLADFDGGRALTGTVETRSGTSASGRVRWDNDEEQSWELLDGRSGGVEYDVELGLVRSIERAGAGVRVELRDGRVLELDGTNDVGEENQGIFVRPEEGGTVLVRWRDLERVTLAP